MTVWNLCWLYVFTVFNIIKIDWKLLFFNVFNCVSVMTTACCLSYISHVYMDTNYRNKKPDQNKNASCKINNDKILIQYGGKNSSSLRRLLFEQWPYSPSLQLGLPGPGKINPDCARLQISAFVVSGTDKNTPRAKQNRFVADLSL